MYSQAGAWEQRTIQHGEAEFRNEQMNFKQIQIKPPSKGEMQIYFARMIQLLVIIYCK